MTSSVLLVSLLFGGAAAAPSGSAPAAAPAPAARERVVVIGDVHGAFDKLQKLLRAAELIDGEGRWSGGGNRLVLSGDLIDRGPADRAVLDLAMRLQDEARAAGGRVHVLLGNHEVMNLVRDLRYVSPQSYAEFSDLENAGLRERALRAFTNGRRGNGDSVKALTAAFEADHPYGYFGRIAAFGPGGAYAEWLLQQPAVVRIDGIVYVHGGLTEDYARLGIERLNRAVHDNVRSFWKLRDKLGLGEFARYEDVQRQALEIVRYGSGEERSAVARELVRLQQEGPAFAADGPLWYRGLSLENERAESASLDAVLKALDARAVVVGHTPTKTGNVQSRFRGRVVRVDGGLLASKTPRALVVEEGHFTVLEAADAADAARSRPRVEPPWGEKWTAGLPDSPDAQLERYLEEAEPTDVRPLGRGSTRPLLVELEQDRVRLRALFKERSEPLPPEPRAGAVQPAAGAAVPDAGPPDRFQHEIAAYRLDRLLGLQMVPVTVARRLDQAWGSLQAWVEAAVTPETAASYELVPRDPAAVALQRERMRIFDALIGNTRRSPSDVLLLPDDSRLLLVDHSSAFTIDGDPLPILGTTPCVIEPRLRDALGHLTREQIEAALDGLVDARQVGALLMRRERLLKVCS